MQMHNRDKPVSDKLYNRYVESVTSPYISEQEILNIRKVINNNRLGDHDIHELVTLMGDNEPRIEPDQAEKGLTWLMNQWKTPKGKERKNNPFGYREEEVLDNFDHFTLAGLYNTATYQAREMGFHSYMPIYRVYAKDGSSFDYTMGVHQGLGAGRMMII